MYVVFTCCRGWLGEVSFAVAAIELGARWKEFTNSVEYKCIGSAGMVRQNEKECVDGTNAYS